MSATSDPNNVSVISDILRYVWLIMVPVLIWFYNRLERVERETYNKDETKDQINFVVQPISTRLDYLEITQKEIKVHLEKNHDLSKSIADKLEKIDIKLNSKDS